jgi:hypothetical protein
VGGLLKAAEAAKLPAYPTMFAAVALVLTTIVGLYAALSRTVERTADPRAPGVEP